VRKYGSRMSPLCEAETNWGAGIDYAYPHNLNCPFVVATKIVEARNGL